MELALSLYRDPGLVRYVLHEVRLPEGAPRAALSLADPVRGPFLVVTREGVFVTCLGEGMSSGDLPIVTRGQLDALLAKLGDWRARAKVLAGMAGKVGGATGIFRRLYEAGDDVSREEMIAASALQPLYAFELFRLLVGAIADMDDAREVVLPILRRANKLSRDPGGVLRIYWKTAWNVSHLTVLTGMSGPRLLDELPESLHESFLSVPLSWGAVRQGLVALALRGAWAAARVGKPLLPGYKRRLLKAVSPLTALDSSLSLGAMAIRHRGLRAEIEKALASAAPVLKEATVLRYPSLTVETAIAVLELASNRAEDLEIDHIATGAHMAVELGKTLPKGSPYAYERPEDVPREIALALPVTNMESLIGNAKAVLPTFFLLPWVARAAPEELYLPGDYLRAIRVPWEPEHTYGMLRPLAEMYRKRQVRPKGPARKGPCPCGSGKKYKRCCGDAEKGAEGSEKEEEGEEEG